MKKEVINDIWVHVDVWQGFYNNDHDAEIRFKEKEAKDFLMFLKDHQSQSDVRAYLEYDRQTICEFCKREWEEEPNGEPVCCTKAVEEFNQVNKK